ncbi:hypothetical protein CROQUDRAFT_658489 [Cronartium quercuum f. sp. fusiforme G11]|uniref:Yeast cell wall synthesis Kre9/Knh1-like N-terminal domain-containing protein n=1 Tax=Cronartium quercuum f. sp. fusiforme G11 TaxID=708437 RepID=A0A9P6NK11_9BASI|nr:hypothetical protein CROQUDRAFT_658489 [Cronartium quercuum f. sp. fusiforme G11]
MNTRSLPHRFFLLFSLLALASLGSSFFISEPKDENEIWYFGHKKEIHWTSVETDPPKVTISISNNDAGTYPTSFSRIIRRGVPKERGKYVIRKWAFEGLKEGSGYRINLLTKEAGAILAQSPLFTLSSWDPSDISPSISADSNDKSKEVHHKGLSDSQKTAADQILTKSVPDDRKRTGCASGAVSGPGVVSSKDRGH